MKKTSFYGIVSEKSITFPDIDLEMEVPFDVKVRDLSNKFGPQKEIIILQGPSGSGKTITLKQFVENNPQTAFSYFLTDNYWDQRPTAFLSSLCAQMAVVLGIHFDDVIDFKIDIEKLKQVFESYSRKIIEIVKKERRVFYFVIDGLEWAMDGNEGERIIDLFPLPHHPRGLYILGSIASSHIDKIKFTYENDYPNPFSTLETQHYLNDLDLLESQIKNIHKVR